MLSLTYNNGYPIVLSDILFSSEDGIKNFSLPTHLDGTKQLISNNSISLSPIDLRQKVYIINERLCVVLGGRLDQMYSFLNYMEAFFKNEIPSIEQLSERLNSYDKDKRSELLALVILATLIGDSVAFDIRTIGKWQQVQHDVFSFIYSGGSGANDFLSTAKHYTGGVGYTNPFNKSIAQNLDILSKCIAFECYSANSILDKWGAGFELTYFFFTKFKKLQEYTYILLKGTFDLETGLTCFPYAILKYKYIEDILVIRAANDQREKLFQVKPINSNRELNIDETNLPEYKSKDHILGFIIRLPNNQIFLPTFVLLVDNHEHVKISVVSGHVEIIIKESLTKYIENEIRKIIK